MKEIKPLFFISLAVCSLQSMVGRVNFLESCGDNQVDRPPEQTRAKKPSRKPDPFRSSKATLCLLLNGFENKKKNKPLTHELKLISLCVELFYVCTEPRL